MMSNPIQVDTNTQPQQIKIQKKIKKVEKKPNKRKYIIQSPDESENECDGWLEEELFDNKSKQREENRTLTNLQCKAWKLEAFLAFAKCQLAELEASLN